MLLKNSLYVFKKYYSIAFYSLSQLISSIIIYRNSGGIGKDLVFLLAEEQIRDEAFLDDINSLLNDGEVPNLFTIEERQEIIEMTRLAAQSDKNVDISILAVLAYFVNRCREKLHIILCLSPIGDAFRIRLRMYPSLVNCCTIDWFDEWPEDALEQVISNNIVLMLNHIHFLFGLSLCNCLRTCSNKFCLYDLYVIIDIILVYFSLYFIQLLYFIYQKLKKRTILFTNKKYIELLQTEK